MKKFIGIMFIIYLIFLIIINVNASNHIEKGIDVALYENKKIDSEEYFSSKIKNIVHKASNMLILTNISQSETNKISSSIQTITQNIKRIDNELVIAISLFLSIAISFSFIVTIFKY